MKSTTLNTLIDAAAGRIPCDLKFTNARIIDVYNLRICRGEVAIKDGIIVGVVFEDEGLETHYDANETLDCKGRFLCPGFIDAHMHIESYNLRPAEFGRLAATRGTTTAVADSHEICNVCGLKGLEFMIEDGKRSPIDIKFMMPSCVPALRDELSGATITSKDMQQFMDKYPDTIFGLGEMMNMPGIISSDQETLGRLAFSMKTASGICDGHAPLLSGKELNAYLTSGIIADHECTMLEEARAKLARGMFVMMRQGTCSKDVKALVPLVIENPARAASCCFATDDRSPSEAYNDGMIDNAIRIAISEGLDPVTAISMATLSPAICFGFHRRSLDPRERRGAIAPGKRADILILDDLKFEKAPKSVYAYGKHVAEKGKVLVETPCSNAKISQLEDVLLSTVKLPDLKRDIFDFEFHTGDNAIEIKPENLITSLIKQKDCKGLRRIVVIERHGRGQSAQRSGEGLLNKYIGRSWISGLPIQNGALASSIGHDSHNVCVVGDNPDDMLLAVQSIGQGAHVLVSNGEVVARISLPLGGLMSQGTAKQVATEHIKFVEKARELGIEPPQDPIMGIIFLALPVIPDIRLRPQGLFDVNNLKYLER